MCKHPGAVFLYKYPHEEKWHTRYYADMTKEEALREGLDIDVILSSAHGLLSRWATVSCGQCIECRLQRSREWANRCTLEAEQYPDGSNWFVTLTISPEMQDRFLTSSGLSLDFGKENGRDVLQQFMVNVRQIFKRERFHDGIRFLACGEYGAERFRPHYHAILFNCPLSTNDLIFSFKNNFGHSFFKSPVLERAWKFGFVDISPANWDNMAYTARYVVKKITGVQALDYYGDLKPPFLRMSRKPGIGLNRFDSYKTYSASFDPSEYDFLVDHDTGEIIGLTERLKQDFLDKVTFANCPPGVPSSFKPPRIFDKHMEMIDSVFIDEVKKIRSEKADLLYETRKKLRPMSDRELFSIEENQLLNSKKGQFRHLSSIF